MARSRLPRCTVPSHAEQDGAEVAAIPPERLDALTDVHLPLEHVHGNVVGPNAVPVHTVLDPQVDAVRLQADGVAERVATRGALDRVHVGARAVASR